MSLLWIFFKMIVEFFFSDKNRIELNKIDILIHTDLVTLV